MRKHLEIAALAALGALLVWAQASLPAVGDPAGPVHSHLTPWYLDSATALTLAPNAVTAVLADVRAFDTLGETTVIFAAGLAAWLALGARR